VPLSNTVSIKPTKSRPSKSNMAGSSSHQSFRPRATAFFFPPWIVRLAQLVFSAGDAVPPTSTPPAFREPLMIHQVENACSHFVDTGRPGKFAPFRPARWGRRGLTRLLGAVNW
jgi:hypothetical protein